MKITKPPDIDFSNKVNDEPFKENIDDIINKTLQERQKKLMKLYQVCLNQIMIVIIITLPKLF